MLRVLAVVVPTSLAVCACSAAPEDRWVGMEAGFELEPLRVSAVESPAGDSGAAPTDSFLEPSHSAPAPQQNVLDSMNSQHVTLMTGQRWLDEDDWEPVEDQWALGVEYDASDPETGHGFEVGVIYSWDSDDVGPVDVDGSVFDLYAGYRHTFRLEQQQQLHPYLSVGGAFVRADVETDGPGPDIDEDDSSLGLYLRGGIGFDVQENMRLGLDYRHMFFTDIDIGAVDDVDYDMVLLTLGFALTNT